MKSTLWLILLFSLESCSSLMVGTRKIKCATPIGGKESDALMEPRPNIPGILGFMGAQAFLPSLGKCPVQSQIQPPWFLGNEQAGGGICPPEFWNPQALLPGLVVIACAAALNSYINSNRLLITEKGMGTIQTDQDISSRDYQEPILFSEISEWFMTPVGLILKQTSTKTIFLPLFWEQKSVEALLEKRLK